MRTFPRVLVSVFALTAAAVLAAGCASKPGASTHPEPSHSAPEQTAPADDDRGEVEVAWLDGGRGIAIVTWGSSSCQPHVENITAAGQTVTVTLVDPEQQACTRDFVPRATMAALPEGVSVTADVEVVVNYADQSSDADLDALPAAPAGPSDQQPSAGWFDDRGIALLTWGSSSCAPIVENVELAAAGAEVTFVTVDGPCTLDLAPRVTVIELPAEPATDDNFTLTLRGDNLDAEVKVLG